MPAVTRKTLVDTGPIVAVLNRDDDHHLWAKEVFRTLTPPLFTCESVLSEVQFLLNYRGGDPLAALELVRKGIVVIDFRAADEIDRLLALQRSYRDLPMDFADACLVRMSELHRPSCIFTIDSHFRIFRRNGRQLIPLVAPPDR